MSTERRRHQGPWGLLALLLVAACAAEPAARASRTQPVDGQPPAGAAAAGASPAAGASTASDIGPGSAPSSGAGAAGSAAPAFPGVGDAAQRDGSRVQPEPPTGVVFEWLETDPDVQRECRAGRYVGMFACELRIVANDGPQDFELSGTIDMVLEESQDGELLRIADGEFFSAAAVAIPAWGDVVGELDCSSGRFDGRIENGRFSVALGLPIPFTEGIFSGSLTADYDHDRAELVDGDWNMTGNLDGFPGSCTNGSWSARRMD